MRELKYKMKRRDLWQKKILVLVLLGLSVMPQFARGEEAEPVQPAVFNPVQLVPEEDSIKGLRLSLFYTVNKDVTGLSLVWLGVNRATGDVRCVEIGLANWVEGSSYGGQAGIVNYSESSFKGFQGGFVNYAAEMHGLQLGIANYTKSLDGLQIGLGNYNGNKKPMEFMVLVNRSF